MTTRPDRKPPTVPVIGHWWRWLQSLPLPESENSILLRVLVQVLVAVGIVATDIAASDVTEWSVTSYWAVPLSILGAMWSWRQRRDRNIPTQFCLAIGMLLALAAFLSRMTAGGISDTRLSLSLLLIQLQVLHSFDLPRRKDLGYSMVIGLILLGVAGTLSQTLAFAPVLLVFIAVAMPVMVLDYRSRLGLVMRSFKRAGRDLAPKRLGAVLLVILGLGLTIFVSLPRFSGYQLRAFPVSATREVQGRFDGSTIVNPGYVRQGREQGGTGSTTGQGQARGPGKLDEKFYYGFDRAINQDLRGQLKPEVVLRVRSQAEGYWRVMAFDRYTGQGWEISRNDQTTKANRNYTYQFNLPRPVTLNKTQDVVQTYTVVTEELPNVIPALSQAKELYFPTEQIAIDSEGGLRSPLALRQGDTYTVISEVPYRDRTRLGKAGDSYPPSIRQYYLQLPSDDSTPGNTTPGNTAQVRQYTLDVLAKSPKPIVTPYEKALYLAQHLKQRYKIIQDLPFFEFKTDVATAFLFDYEGGYPDHFSTTLTVMLRSIGIPARLATGFGPGQFNPFTGLYIVRNTDAYAVTEVYFPKFGWFSFDPIPGHELFPPSIEENQTFSVLKQFWQWVAGWLPSPVRGLLSSFFGAIFNGLTRLITWFVGLFSRGWVGLFTALIVTTALGFLGWLGWRGWRVWRYRFWLARLPVMEGIYQQMLRQLAKQGFRKRSAQTPLEYADQVREHNPTEAEAVDEISQAYVRWRYGAQDPDLAVLRRRLRELQQQPKPRSRV